MSIINKLKIFFVAAALSTPALSAEAVSIRVMDGGIPLGDYHSMVEDGLRLGSTELLREAWTHYEDAIKFDKDQKFATTSYLELGRIYFYLSLLGNATNEDYAKVEGYAKEALYAYPDDSNVHEALGLIFAGKGSYMDAFEELSLALNLNPANEMVLCDMASLHLALHEPDKTIEDLEKTSECNGWGQIILAMAYSQKEQLGRAYLALLRAEKLGYKGYWVDSMRKSLTEKLKIVR